ncbi:MAG: S1 RNA-binding domain-containing protein, partial [Patescibacteria group bacterium]
SASPRSIAGLEAVFSFKIMTTTDVTKNDLEILEKDADETSELATIDTGMANMLLSEERVPAEEGDLVEGAIIGFGRGSVYVDLAPFGTGIIYGREYMNARDVIRRANIGDIIAAKVVEAENENGYTELSLKEARQALTWGEAEDAIKKKTLLELPVKDANKGGLILEWQGIQGFLPASQLSQEHYPRVEDGNKDQILGELKKFIGTKLSVQIINASPKEGKLIFSERGMVENDKAKIVSKYHVGDEVTGEITGIVDFGVFLKVEEGLEGLVHISEIDWGLVEDPKALFKVREKVKAKIIEIKDDKISLSIKALKENPWGEAKDRYKKGDIVDGVVIKFNKHGALVSIEEGVAGLVHVSEFSTEQKLRETLELGKTYKFKITFFEPKDQKMTLSYAEADKKEEK